MARRQVLVQLDDSLVERLDELAERVGTSRSELLRRGAEAVLRCEDEADADRKLIEAYRSNPPDSAFAASTAKLAAETSPEW